MRPRINVLPQFADYHFVLKTNELEYVTVARATRFELWVNYAYFKTSIACHYFNLWHFGQITSSLWLVFTQESMDLFAKREARELLR
ncbi:MAG: hypothetical protein WC761_03135 [Candidatus Paceibacterota bacterium]|jgi:hypothetical protein